MVNKSKTNSFTTWAPAAGLIVLITWFAYLPALSAGFVWDDDRYVTDSGVSPDISGLRRIWFEPGATIQYYPLTFTSFWIEYHLWGFGPRGYHLVNILLHAINALFLWQLLRKLGIPGPWLAAAVFAVHPVHVESVAWITERKNVLSGVFYFSAWLAYLRFHATRRAQGPRPGVWQSYALAVILFLMAMLSKTVACTLPLAVMLMLWWKDGRLSWRDMGPLFPMLVLAGVMGLITVWFEKSHVGALGEAWNLSAVERFLVAGRAVTFYLGKLLWPAKLTFLYPRWNINAGIGWQYLYPLGVIGTVSALWLLRTTLTKAPLLAALFFLVTLAPALGFVNVYFMQYSFVADHFQYLASIAPITLVAGLAATFLKRPAYRHMVAVVVLPPLMILTWHQTKVYHDMETLWRDTLAKNPSSWLAHTNLGVCVDQAGDLDGAIRHGTMALELNPNYEIAHNNMASFLAKKGRFQEAVQHLLRALQIRPDYIAVYKNLGHVLLFQGDIKGAMSSYRRALQFNPNWPEVANHLAWLLATYPDPAFRDGSEAVQLATRACEATAYQEAGLVDTLAAAYAEAGRFPEAVATAEKAMARAQAVGEVHLLADVQARLRQFQARQPYRDALLMHPPESAPAQK